MSRFNVKCGVVGCGVIANDEYIPAIRRYGILKAVCDIREDRARRTARVWDVEEHYTSLSEMLERANLDSVFVLTGMGVHAKQVVEAARAGKHVLVQKPLATSMDGLREAVGAVRKAGVKVLVEPNVHMNPLYRRAGELLSKAGEPYWFRAGFGRSPPIWGRETFFTKGAGGPLFDLGVYEVSILTLLLGPVRRVAGMARISVPEVELIDEGYLTEHLREVKTRSIWSVIAEAPRVGRARVEAEDNVVALLEMRQGALGVLVSNYITPRQIRRPSRVEVYCSRGGLDVGGGSDYQDPVLTAVYLEDDEPKRVAVSGRELGLVEWDGRYSWNYYEASTRHFLECIAEDRDPIPGLDWGAHVSEVLIRALESARRGRALEVGSTFEPYARPGAY